MTGPGEQQPRNQKRCHRAVVRRQDEEDDDRDHHEQGPSCLESVPGILARPSFVADAMARQGTFARVGSRVTQPKRLLSLTFSVRRQASRTSSVWL